MNCANHPDVEVAAYCQNCGKGLCSNCVRSVGGMIYCEPCLSARLGLGGAPGVGTAVPPPPGVIAQGGPSPAAAFILGFIPGVGAMYNGQFIKGLVHVLVFIILIGITNHVGVFGIAIAGWVAYQVFDAFETAKARREGRPLPDPFGLNDFGAKMGIPGHWPGAAGPGVAGPAVAQGFTGGVVPPVPPPPAAGFTGGPYSGAPYSGPGVPPVPPQPGCGWDRGAPIGAVILIGLVDGRKGEEPVPLASSPMSEKRDMGKSRILLGGRNFQVLCTVRIGDIDLSAAWD